MEKIAFIFFFTIGLLLLYLTILLEYRFFGLGCP